MCMVDWSLSLANWDWKVKTSLPGNAPFQTSIDIDWHTLHKTSTVDRNDKTWTVDRNGVLLDLKSRFPRQRICSEGFHVLSLSCFFIDIMIGELAWQKFYALMNSTELGTKSLSILQGLMSSSPPFLPKLTLAVAEMFQPVFRITLFTTTRGCFTCWEVSMNGISQS